MESQHSFSSAFVFSMRLQGEDPVVMEKGENPMLEFDYWPEE